MGHASKYFIVIAFIVAVVIFIGVVIFVCYFSTLSRGSSWWRFHHGWRLFYENWCVALLLIDFPCFHLREMKITKSVFDNVVQSSWFL